MSRPSKRPPSDPETARLVEECIENVRHALSSLQFGHIVLTVHDGRVVQMEVTEKTRFS